MNLLALDQASKCSGYSVFDLDTQSLVAYGKFTFDDPDIEQRLVKIRNKVVSLIEEYKIEKMAVEDIQYQEIKGQPAIQNVVTFKTLAEVFGVVTELAAELQIPCTVVSSNTWKSTCGIHGKARPEQKRNAQAHVLQKYNIKVTQDEADAVCIGEHMARQSINDWSS